MSRSNQRWTEQESVEEDGEERLFDDGMGKVLTDFSFKPKKVAIMDADTILYLVNHRKKLEDGSVPTPYGIEDLETVQALLDEAIINIIIKIEKYFEIEALYICVKGKKNIRHYLSDCYKSKRPPSPVLISPLIDFLEKQYNCIRSHNFEADDYVYSISKTIDHQGIIISVDKDLKSIPGIHFNYMKCVWDYINVPTSRFNLACQVLTGDSTDGILGVNRVGIKTAQKLLNKNMTDYQFMKTILQQYKKCYGIEGKEKMKLCYSLVKLYDVNEK